MRKTFLAFVFSFATIVANCQTSNPDSSYNLGFEIVEKGIPIGWNIFGGSAYKVALDSTNVKSGKYSALFEFNEGSAEFKALGFTLPSNYEGKKITLSGFIKTENVNEGYAGLWMRIDPSIAFDNMNNNGVKGSTDWTKYEITLDMNPEKTTHIVVGGILVGKGKMWVDDLRITIDGKDLANVKTFEKKLLLADKDKEFDGGSKVTIQKLNNAQIENLRILGLIWGYLKYYHPTIAGGNYNWDYELFRILPSILAAENPKKRDAILTEWITKIGPLAPPGENPPKPSEIKLEPDLGWIMESKFSNELSSLLNNVKNSKRPSVHYYIELQPNVANPNFKNENAYSKMSFPDVGFRLLALYRYWNIIQYFFPYKNLIEEDWKNVLKEFIPKVIDVNNETEYTLAILELIGRVHDTHANIWGGNPVLNNHLGLRYAPFELAFVENKPVVTGYYDKPLGKESGMEIGDVITKIDNQPVEKIVGNRLKYSPASNYPTKARDIARNLLRTNDSVINVEFKRNDKLFNKVVRTFSTKEINIYSKYSGKDTCFKLINQDIAYINNGSLKKNYLPEIWKSVQNTKGLIIDIRNYPSDFVIYDLSNYLMPESKPFVKFSNGSIEYPGLFTFTKPMNAGKSNTEFYPGKVVILINEISQSSAEFHAMAYRTHPNAVVIGSTTAGADGNVSRFYLPGGIMTMISGIGVYYPNGKETQRVGIIPDIEIKPTIKGIKEGRDELMERALEIIKKGKPGA